MPNIADLLDEYRLLWTSYLPCTDDKAQKRLILAMMEIRDATELSDADWDAFTATLPGFDEWWLRVREEYIERLKAHAENMESEG